MKAPPRLQSLIDEGLIDTVVRQLMSGKEAMVFVVRLGDETRCAKIYKEAHQRSFRQAVDYTENRKVKNSRSARAMAKGSRFGRQEQEAAWQNAEVDALYRLAAAGVRVPQPFNFHDGVLLMELVTDAHGDAAPRLNDVSFSPEDARTHHATLVAEVVRMLCAGVVHGDLSEFNILLAHLPGTDGAPAAAGPVIIDLPQAVDAAGNNHAQRMLLRDVANLRDFFGQFAPELLATRYGPEIWSLYQRGLLSNDTLLTGRYTPTHAEVDLADLRDHTFITLTQGFATHQDGVRVFKQAGFEPKVAMQVNDIFTLLSMVSSGVGYALLPGRIAAVYENRVKLIPLQPRYRLQQHIGVVFLKAKERDPNLLALLAECRMYANRQA